MKRPTPRTLLLGSVSEKVYAALLRDIESGARLPHSRLPTERDLCREFGASRTAVRRAVGRLVAEGRAVSRQGSGSFVAEAPTGAAATNTISVMYLGSAERLTAIQDAALRKGCVLAVYSQARSGWDPRSEAKFLRQVERQRHRGLVAFCSPIEPRNDELLRKLDRSGVRVVHIEHYREALPDQSHILLDYRRAAHAAAVTLMLAGYRRLVFAGMSGSGPFCRLEERGFLEAVAEHTDGNGERLEDLSGKADGGNYLDLPSPGEGGGFERKLDSLAGALPRGSGVVCASYQWAIWLKGALERRDAHVPEDVGSVTVRTLGDDEGGAGGIDHVDFGDDDPYLLAVEALSRPDFDGVRELVPPRVVKCGTVRDGG